MKKIFIKNQYLKSGEIITVDEEDYHHLSRVLRVKPGEKFIAGDYDGNEFTSSIHEITNRQIELSLTEPYYREKFMMPEIHLYFSLLKGDKNESVIQKGSELGVTAFYPVITDHTIIKPDDSSTQKKLEKFRVIARESAMQSARSRIAEVFPVMSFQEFSKKTINSLKIFGYIDHNTKQLKSILDQHPETKEISFFIGPEGDFSQREIHTLLEKNWIGAKLGATILKSDTAIYYVCSSVLFNYGRGVV